jgi:hypothetical protein
MTPIEMTAGALDRGACRIGLGEEGVTRPTGSRSSSIEHFLKLLPRPANQTTLVSKSTATEQIPKSKVRTRWSFCCPPESSRIHTAPVSVQMIASFSDMLVMQVKLESTRLPRRQFLPGSAIGVEPAAESGSLQTLMCRVPTLKSIYQSVAAIISGGPEYFTYVIIHRPIQHMSRTKDVHLFVE